MSVAKHRSPADGREKASLNRSGRGTAKKNVTAKVRAENANFRPIAPVEVFGEK